MISSTERNREIDKETKSDRKENIFSWQKSCGINWIPYGFIYINVLIELRV